MRITVTDDLDGTEGARSVQFGLDGETFEIDLSEANRAKLAGIVNFYIRHGRKAGPVSQPRHASVYAHFGSRGRSGAPLIKAGRK